MSDRFPFKLPQQIFSLHDAGIPAGNVVSVHGVGYVPIPKCACTALKIACYEAQTGETYSNHFDAIHEEFDYAACDMTRFSADCEHVKMVVLREPIARFLSAFNNRVIDRQELSERWFTEHAPNDLRSFADRDLPFDPDIGLFIDRIEDYIAASQIIQHHFVPQFYFFVDLNFYDAVFTTDRLVDVQTFLSQVWQLPVALRRVQESSKTLSLSDIDSRRIDRLREFYARDHQAIA